MHFKCLSPCIFQPYLCFESLKYQEIVEASGEWDEPSQTNKWVVRSPVALTFMAHYAEVVLHTSVTIKAVLLEIQGTEDWEEALCCRLETEGKAVLGKLFCSRGRNRAEEADTSDHVAACESGARKRSAAEQGLLHGKEAQRASFGSAVGITGGNSYQIQILFWTVFEQLTGGEKAVDKKQFRSWEEEHILLGWLVIPTKGKMKQLLCIVSW